ncbi:LysR substrate-binding domain-containing protein [Undibacterium arcticum]
MCFSCLSAQKNGSPKTPSDLIGHTCIGYSYAATADEWNFTDENGQANPVKVSCVMHTNNGDTARAAALAGLGIIWQPSFFLIGADLRAGRLVPLLPGYRLPDIDVLAVYPSRRHLSAKVRVMVDFLADAFKETPHGTWMSSASCHCQVMALDSALAAKTRKQSLIAKRNMESSLQ